MNFISLYRTEKSTVAELIGPNLHDKSKGKGYGQANKSCLFLFTNPPTTQKKSAKGIELLAQTLIF